MSEQSESSPEILPGHHDSDPPVDDSQKVHSRERPSVAGAVEFEMFALTDTGLVRDHNEDNVLCADLGDEESSPSSGSVIRGVLGSRGLVFGVCDGMGGAAAGEIASHMAVDRILEFVRGNSPAADRDDLASRLIRAVEQAGEEIYASARADQMRQGMGTTATIGAMIDRVLFVAQVGDSRCYVLRDGRLALVTRDQSLVNQLLEAGQLTAEEAEVFEHSNIILQALGTAPDVVVDLTFVELRRGDRILFCSDGLSGFVSESEMCEELRSARSISSVCERLVKCANAAGGFDNVSVVICDVDGPGLDGADSAPQPFYQQYPLPDTVAGPRRASSTGPVIKSLRPRVSAVSGAQARSRAWTAGVAAAVLGVLVAITGLVVRSSREAAREAEVHALAAARADRAVVEIVSSLDDSVLYLDGKNLGSIPKDGRLILEVAPGPHSIEARGKHGRDVKLLELGPGDEVTLDFLSSP